MKLKKIASLMLAGIMAVSMLTACGDSTTNNTGDDSSSSQPTVSNASNVMWNGMNKEARDIVDPVANATLENSLRKNVEIYGNLDNVVEYVLSHVNSTVSGDRNITATPVDVSNIIIWDKIAQDMGITSECASTGECLADNNGKDAAALRLYATNFSVSDQYALEYVGQLIDEEIAELPLISKDEDVEYDYEISASIVSENIANEGLGTQMTTVKFIAVYATRTATRVSPAPCPADAPRVA